MLRNRHRLTASGVLLLASGIALCLAGWFLREPTMLWPGAFLALLPIGSWVALWFGPGRLRARRVADPAEVPAGGELLLGLRLTAARPTLPWLVTVSDVPPPSFGTPAAFSSEAPRGRAEIRHTYRRTPTRRGRYTLDGLSVGYTDPLGLASRRVSPRATTEVVVTPRVLPLSGPELGASGRMGDAPLPQLATTGPDDVLVREYRPRDDVRRIHWPSTARTGTLIVRSEEQAWDPAAIVVADDRAVAFGGDEARFEWAVSLTASVGVVLLDHGFDLQLVFAGGRHHLPATRHHGDPSGDWLLALVDATTTPADTLRPAVEIVEAGASEHLLVVILGRLGDAESVDLVQMGETSVRRWLLYIPAADPGADVLRAERAAVERLEDNGWLVEAAAVGIDPEQAWSGLSVGGWVR